MPKLSKDKQEQSQANHHLDHILKLQMVGGKDLRIDIKYLEGFRHMLHKNFQKNIFDEITKFNNVKYVKAQQPKKFIFILDFDVQ